MNIERIVTQTANLKNNIAETIAKEAGETIKQVAESKITKAAALGIVASATGVMLANKTKEEQRRQENEKYNPSRLRNLGFSEETIDKVLSAKKHNNKPVFDAKAIKALKETSKVKDKTFFYYTMKNIDNVTSFTRTQRKDGTRTYKLSVDAPEGLKTAKMIVDKYGSVVDFVEQNEDGTTLYRSRSAGDGGWAEDRTLARGEKTLHDESIEYRAEENIIERNEYDKEDPNRIISTRKTKITPEGVIDDNTMKEYSYDDKGYVSVKQESVDYRNNKTKTVAQCSGDYDEVKELERSVKNPLTGKSEVQKMKLSDVPGVYNSVIIDENGNEKVESLGRVNPDGSTHVEKNLESLDGVKTHYVREASKNEDNIKTFYQITDKDGKVLTTVDRTFKRISPTKAYSSINGHGYSIEKQEKAYVVTDLASQKTYVMKNKNLFKNNESRKHPEMIDQMSGDMLIDMFNRGYKYRYNKDALESYTDAQGPIIETEKDMFVFAHEQGHSKDIYIDPKNVYDYGYNITTNPLFREEFDKERQQFMKAFPELQQSYIEYFIDQINHYGGINGGAAEAVAETNAMYSTASGYSDLAMRAYYLQKYFPRSIAAASYLLNPNSNLYVQNS
ncbi:MAG: hypothetical protein DKM22_02215 [Candidatus Melainabacteria bacterium]|nr:MAG: hypothetical protein DKM22_02215 [Candidatus Melainabacteria bacterium]